MGTLKLKWSEPSPPTSGCRYDHVTAETPFGRFLLTWKSWKEAPSYGFDETPWNDLEYHGWQTIEEACAWAETELQSRLERTAKLLSYA